MLDGILDKAMGAFDIFKPSQEQSTFNQAEYPGQGLVKLGQDAMKKPPQKMEQQISIPELNTQMELQKKAPFVARTPDQAVLNQPTQEAADSKSSFDPNKLMMALSTIKPKEQQKLMSTSSGRTGGGFRAPDASLYDTPWREQYMQQLGSPRAKSWSQMIPNLPN